MAPIVKLTPKQKLYLDWLVTPTDQRQPSTQSAFSKQHQVSENTLRAWKKDLGFQEHWNRRLAELQIDPERVDQVMGAIYTKAANGDMKAAAMYLEVVERYRPSSAEVLQEPRKALQELSDDELNELIAAHVQDELRARRDRS